MEDDAGAPIDRFAADAGVPLLSFPTHHELPEVTVQTIAVAFAQLAGQIKFARSVVQRTKLWRSVIRAAPSNNIAAIPLKHVVKRQGYVVKALLPFKVQVCNIGRGLFAEVGDFKVTVWQAFLDRFEIKRPLQRFMGERICCCLQSRHEPRAVKKAHCFVVAVFVSLRCLVGLAVRGGLSINAG